MIFSHISFVLAQANKVLTIVSSNIEYVNLLKVYLYCEKNC